MADLQERLYAQDRWSVLLIFQAMDAAGKDGTIKHVMSGLNPQGCEVHAFKAPSSEELDHDFLWRTSTKLPRRGHIGIFNRSYYEEMLVVRVHPEILARQQLPDELVTQPDLGPALRRRRATTSATSAGKASSSASSSSTCRRRSSGAASSTGCDQPEKNWKFSLGDVHEREHFDDYLAAYEDVIRHTATPSRRGTSCRPTTSGSPGWSWPRPSLTPSSRCVRRFPSVDAATRQQLQVARGGPRKRGAGGPRRGARRRLGDERHAGLIDAGRRRRRCAWCGVDPLYVAYHDEEWGRPVADDRRLFEKICLEGFQSGLSWLTILRKRE